MSVSAASVVERALAAVDKMEARLAAAECARTEPVAVVGLACRFEGASSLEQLWDVVTAGPAAGAVRRDGGRALARQFDAEPFGFTGAEAAQLGDADKLLLSVAWEALERGGHNPSDLFGARMGIFLAVGEKTDGGSCARSLTELIGNRGPSVVTADDGASSLVGVHLAVQSLRSGECAAAIVGAVNVLDARPAGHHAAGDRPLLCHPFSEGAAAGTRSEACVVLILKRASDAVRAGDFIWGLVRGSAVQHDGRPATRLTLDPVSKEAVIRQALHAASCAPADIDVVEAHGSGAPLEDLAEVEAIKAVFAGDPPMALGSIKGAVGHAGVASGLASVVQVLLALEHDVYPRTWGFQSLNPLLGPNFPLTIAAEPVAWRRREKRRVACVNALGASGANAHVVIEEAAPPAMPEPGPGPRPVLLPVSARTPDALRARAARLARDLRYAPDRLDDVCHTLWRGRAQLRERLAVIGSDAGDIASRLEAFAAAGDRQAVFVADAPPLGEAPVVAWAFGDHSPFDSGGARAAIEAIPAARIAWEECERAAAGRLSLDPAGRDPEDARLRTVCLQIVAAELLRSSIGEPDCVLAGGLGWYAAHLLAERSSVADVVRLVIAGQPAPRAVATSIGDGARVPLYSLAGREATDADPHADPANAWGRAAALLRLRCCDVLLDLGAAYAPPSADTTRARPALRHLRGDDTFTSLLEIVAELFVHGAFVKHRALAPESGRRIVPLSPHSNLDEPAADHAPPARSRRSPRDGLIVYRHDPTEPLLACVHALDGRARRHFRPLARNLPRELSFVAFEASGLSADDTPAETVEAIARDYVDAICDLRPRGPYHLCGWSFGGHVALEMARLIRGAGETVGGVVLIDSYPPPKLDEIGEDANRKLEMVLAELGFPIAAGALRSLTDDEAAAYILDMLARHLQTPADPVAHRRLLRVYERHIAALRRYRPRALAIPIDYVRARTRLGGGDIPVSHSPGDVGWSFVSPEVRVHRVAGDHLTMIREPHVAELAKVIAGIVAVAQRSADDGATEAAS